MVSGVTADTPVNLAIGAGIVRRNNAIFGASMDSNRFAVERSLFTPALNGLMGELMGTDFIQNSVPRIESTIPEVGAGVIAAGIPGAEVDDSDSSDVVISDATARRLANSAYANWSLGLERQGGGQFLFEVDHALNTAAFDSELQDAGVFAPRYTLSGRRDAADPDASPWRIRVQTAGS